MKRIGLFLATAFFAMGAAHGQETAELKIRGRDVKGQEITRDQLLKGYTIPDKREYKLSTSVAPCADFHKYVCENEEKNFKLPKNRSSWTFSFKDNSERLLHAKKTYFQLLEKGHTPKNARSAQFKNYYLACMNVPANKRSEKEFVTEQTKLISNLKTRDELKKLVGERIFSPYSSFASFGQIPSQKDPTRYDIYVYADLMMLPERSYYEQPKLMKDYQALVVQFFKDIGMSNPAKRAQGVLDIEKEFAQKFPLPRDIRDRISQNNYEKRDAFAGKYPNVPLAPLWTKIPANIETRNFIPESLDYLNAALNSKSEESLKDFLIYKTVESYLDDAYQPYFKKKFAFNNKYFGGPEVRPDRQERCTQAAMGNFSFEVDAELLPVLFPDFPKDKVKDLSEKVRTALISDIKKNTWLSPSARKEALKKVETAGLFVAYPDRDEDWDFVIEKTYDPKEPVKNKLTYHEMSLEKLVKEISKERNRRQWSMGPLVLNAYYSPADNQFFMLQGILQHPFFDPTRSELENLGAIGVIVGHEVGHGIDDQGAKYDHTGKLRNWMTEKDLQEFRTRGEIFVEQFNKVGHDGRLTLGENIGDHVGLSAAYTAAFAGQKEVKSEDQQKFFVSYAKAWCGVARPEYEKMVLKTDPHALPKERINQQVRHLEGFHQAFSCEAGDAMFLEPAKRVKVW